VAPSPDGKTIVITADHDGDEFHQIYSLPSTGGWPEQWTEAPQVQLREPGRMVSGREPARICRERPRTDRLDIGCATPTAVGNLFGEGCTHSRPRSPDGRKLLALDFRSNTDTTLHLIDVRSGDSASCPHEGGQVHPGAVGEGRLRLTCWRTRDAVFGSRLLTVGRRLRWPRRRVTSKGRDVRGRPRPRLDRERPGLGASTPPRPRHWKRAAQPQLPAGSISSGSALRLAPAARTPRWSAETATPPDLYTMRRRPARLAS
jgi:hypothetical protein